MEKNCWLRDSCKGKHCGDEFCEILYKLNYLFDAANVSQKLRQKISLYPDADGTDLAEFKQLKEIQENILEFVSKGNQLYIHSNNCGNGKTAWALRLLQTYFKKIWLKTDLRCRGLFINVQNLLLSLKENITHKDEYIEYINKNIYSADLVIWDDIGTKAATEFEHSHLFSMIDKRISLGKSNIFTSNLNRQELQEVLGDRLASRICNLGIDIELNGGDKRGSVE